MAEKGKHMRNTEDTMEKIVYMQPQAEENSADTEKPDDDSMYGEYMDDSDNLDDFITDYDDTVYDDAFPGSGFISGLMDMAHTCGEIFRENWRKSKAEMDTREARRKRIEHAKARENDDILVLAGGICCDVEKVIARVMSNVTDVGRAIECTTDVPEEKPDGTMQVNGEDFFFITAEEFQRMEDFDGFVYSVEFDDGKCYGCPKDHIGYLRLMGKRTILLLTAADDALYIKENYPAVTTVFMMPPTKEEAIRRIKAGGKTDEAEIKDRLELISWTLEHAGKFDHLVAGADEEQAACEIANIIYSKRSHSGKRRKQLAEAISSFSTEE